MESFFFPPALVAGWYGIFSADTHTQWPVFSAAGIVFEAGGSRALWRVLHPRVMRSQAVRSSTSGRHWWYYDWGADVAEWL